MQLPHLRLRVAGPGEIDLAFRAHASGVWSVRSAAPAVEPVGALIAHAFRPITEKAAHKGRLFQLSGGERGIDSVLRTFTLRAAAPSHRLRRRSNPEGLSLPMLSLRQKEKATRWAAFSFYLAERGGLIRCFAPSPFGRLRRPTGCAGGRTRWGSHRPCFPPDKKKRPPDGRPFLFIWRREGD